MLPHPLYASTMGQLRCWQVDSPPSFIGCVHPAARACVRGLIPGHFPLAIGPRRSAQYDVSVLVGPAAA